MRNQPITMLKQLFETEVISEDVINDLKKDDRKGVQKLIKSYEKKLHQEQLLAEKYAVMFLYEQEKYEKGCQLIAGVDEAGRGPLAGPVVAAAVILPRDFKLYGLTDSKQLNKNQRDHFYEIITEQAMSYGISIIDNEEIDRINILEATKQAMRICLSKLNPRPDHVLIDAVDLESLPYPSEAIIKGDQKSISIAAASIIAKVTRDKLMEEIHSEYPVYKFMFNRGYGTKQHLESLKKHGVSPYHRRSFSPVQNVINK